MPAADQSAVITFLGSPSTYGGQPVERIDTHASIVFLAGDRALKLKRAVRYDYLDFSTVERRRAMCEAELLINRRTAPGIYLRVSPVTLAEDGSFGLDGPGSPVDWVVEMKRFDQAGLLDRLAAAGSLDLALMRPLASAIATFHQAAERTRRGGADAVARVIDGNAAGFSEHGAGLLDPERCAELTGAARAALDRESAALDRRRAAGLVRRCHGDLHLRNIVLLDGRPTLFDAIEFNDDFSCIDVLYDLAFLLMDLWRRRLPRHANTVFNGYLAATGDYRDLSVLPLFLSCRAAVRAKTSATSASLQADPQRQANSRALSREYLDMARQLLQPAAARVIAVGGLSGSGKSTLALALAPDTGAVPGAVVLRSDEIRKRLLGVADFTHLPPDGYAHDVSRQVYQTIADRAAVVAAAGHTVIADAVYARPADRAAIEQAAAAAGVPFVGLWLDAPEETLVGRVARRGPDASDADASVIRTQHEQDPGAITWHRIDAAADARDVLARARGRLGRPLR